MLFKAQALTIQWLRTCKDFPPTNVFHWWIDHWPRILWIFTKWRHQGNWARKRGLKVGRLCCRQAGTVISNADEKHINHMDTSTAWYRFVCWIPCVTTKRLLRSSTACYRFAFRTPRQHQRRYKHVNRIHTSTAWYRFVCWIPCVTTKGLLRSSTACYRFTFRTPSVTRQHQRR